MSGGRSRTPFRQGLPAAAIATHGPIRKVMMQKTAPIIRSGLFFRCIPQRSRISLGTDDVAGGVSDPASVRTRTTLSGVVITPSGVQP